MPRVSGALLKPDFLEWSTVRGVCGRAPWICLALSACGHQLETPQGEPPEAINIEAVLVD